MKRVLLLASFVSALMVALFSVSARGDIELGWVPFDVTPSYRLHQSPFTDITLFARQSDAYVPFRLSVTVPYGLLSSAASLTQFLGNGGVPLNIPATIPGIGPASQFVAYGRFTADGSPGVAYDYPFTDRNRFRVVLANSAYTYREAGLYTVGKETAGLIAADFNGDNRPDIAALYSGDFANDFGRVGIFLNNGSGSFSAPTYYSTGQAASSVASLDINHDNILDLAVTDGRSSPGAVYIFLGTGNGSFTPAGNYPCADYPASVTIADFNRDSHPDLAVSGSEGVVTILQGTGAGSFQPASTFTVNTTRANYIAAGDLNADGNLDLVTANMGDTITVARGLGNGSFQVSGSYASSHRPDSLVLTDFNLDGKLDVLNATGDARALSPSFGSGFMDVLLGNGDLTLRGVAVSNFSPQGAAFVLTADFNGDGRPDAVAGGQFIKQLFVFNGTVNGALGAPVAVNVSPTTSSTGPLAGVAGDFNGDGRPDLAVAESFTNSVAVLLNNGNGFQPPSRFDSQGDKPLGLVSADFNADGKADLAVINGPFPGAGKIPGMAVFIGGGNGAFTLQQNYNAGLRPTSIATADVNKDGRPDLIVTDQGNEFVTPPVQGAVKVFLNTGTAFAAPQQPVTSGHVTALAVGDLNADGNLDIAFGSQDDSFGFRVGTILGSPSGFLPAKLHPADFNPVGLVIADFNRDSKADIVVAHCCGDTMPGFFPGNGDGTLGTEVLFKGLSSPAAIASRDLNGDTLPDLLGVSGQLGSIAVMLNTGQAAAAVVNAASFSADLTIAPNSIATVFGNHLASGTALSDSTIVITDGTGRSRTCTLFAVFPSQINFLVPGDLEPGLATIRVTSKDGFASGGYVTVANVAPGIFSAGSLANGIVVRYDATGKQLGFDFTVQAGPGGSAIPKPVVLPQGETVYLLLYGTGIRGATQSQVVVQAGSTRLTTQYAGAQGEFAGEDQINVPLPASLRGAGEVTITTTVAGKAANTVKLTIQ